METFHTHTPQPNSNITMKGIHALPLEILERVLEFAMTEFTDLGARLACRGFRNASWKGLATYIDLNTTFDMRSHKSMMNLKAISEKGELTERIKGLTLGSFHVPHHFPGAIGHLDPEYMQSLPPISNLNFQVTRRNIGYLSTPRLGHWKEAEYLSPTTVQELAAIRKESHEWDATYATIYIFSRISHPEEFDEPDHITTFLTECFRQFPVLSRAALIHKPFARPSTCEGTLQQDRYWLPKRYENVFEELKTRFKRPYTLWDQLETGDICDEETTMALDRFVKALSGAGKLPTKLQIPVETLDISRFRIHTSKPVLRKLLKHVEQLTVSIFVPDVPISFRQGKKSVFRFSERRMPNLRHLILDVGEFTLNHRYRLAKPSLLPKITHLTIRSNQVYGLPDISRVGDTVPAIPQLMHHYQATLKHVSIINLVAGPWSAFLELCRNVELERLDLTLEDHFFNAQGRAECYVPDEAQLFRAAPVVNLSPEYYKMLDWQWERSADARDQDSDSDGDGDGDGEEEYDERVTAAQVAIGHGYYKPTWLCNDPSTT